MPYHPLPATRESRIMGLLNGRQLRLPCSDIVTDSKAKPARAGRRVRWANPNQRRTLAQVGAADSHLERYARWLTVLVTVTTLAGVIWLYLRAR